MTKLSVKNIFAVLDDYDALLFDLWGVIVEGSNAKTSTTYPGVVDNINKILQQKKVFFVTNAPRSTASSLKRMQSWGVNASLEMIITSGEIAREAITGCKREFGIQHPVVYHLGESVEQDILDNLHCSVTNNIDEANILLITIARDEHEDLNEFDQLLQTAVKRGIINICANPDIIAPNHGVIRYCSGYFAAKIEALGGVVRYTGKPYNVIYDKVLKQLPGIAKNRILMIGDTFATDILGANQAGINSALVLTGNAETFHGQHSTIEDKLQQLQIAAEQLKAVPNFIIQLV